MKDGIHPQYYKDAKITCACGASFELGSTEKAIHVEICSMCHPFYTGKEKLLDTAGRVDKFKKRMAAAEGFNKTKELKSRSDGRDPGLEASGNSKTKEQEKPEEKPVKETTTDNK